MTKFGKSRAVFTQFLVVKYRTTGKNGGKKRGYNFVLVERNLLLFVIPYIIIIYSLRKEVDIMNYISVKAASEKWGISERRIQKLCEENRIDGTEKFGRAWMIPKDAEKPVDGRMKTRNKQEENHGI